MWHRQAAAFLGAYEASLGAAVTDLNVEQRDKEMSANLELKGLAGALRDLKAFATDASNLRREVAGTLSDASGTVAQVKDLHTQVKAAVAEVQAELGMSTNGGPPLDDNFPAASADSAAPAPALPDAARRGDPPAH